MTLQTLITNLQTAQSDANTLAFETIDANEKNIYMGIRQNLNQQIINAQALVPSEE